jgi:hypothetical protein
MRAGRGLPDLRLLAFRNATSHIARLMPTCQPKIKMDLIPPSARLRPKLSPKSRFAAGKSIFLAAIVEAAAIVLSACAVVNPMPAQTPQQRAQEMDPILQAAGFTSAAAETPEQRQHLKSLPPLKLGYYVDKSGNPNYWMADPDGCGCLFHGDESAYQRYKRIRLENEVAARDRQAMDARQQQMMMMGGPGFGPPGLGPPGLSFGFGGGGFGFGF